MPLGRAGDVEELELTEYLQEDAEEFLYCKGIGRTYCAVHG